jgi:tetratricopeptide (TPR) repeat protein
MRALSPWLVLGLVGLTISAAGQDAGDPGVIKIDASLAQISVEQGSLHIGVLGDPDTEDEALRLDRKLGLLADRVELHLAMSEEQEDRQYSDEESLYRGTNFARKLVAKIELLSERIAYLGDNTEFNTEIEAAAVAFDVPLIKKCLREKLALEDDNVAEAAFQLAGFQELDGEYQDAWGNYQKASNLEPDNQLYMDAHGKNEF